MSEAEAFKFEYYRGYLVTGVLVGCQPETKATDLVDDAGRQVVIEKIPERIVSFAPSTTEICLCPWSG